MYTKALEELDARVGRVHQVEDWRAAAEKSQQAPETLTEDDLVILEGFEGARCDARARRLAVLFPTPPPDPPPAALVTKQMAPAVKVPEGLEWAGAWLQKHGTQRVSGTLLVRITDMLLTIIKAEQSPRKALEARVLALEARVLELEAHRAATHEPVTEGEVTA